MKQTNNYNLYLNSIDKNKTIQTIKVIRDLTKCSLKEAKDMIDKRPSLIVSNVSIDKCKDIEMCLLEIGATTELKSYVVNNTIRNNNVNNVPDTVVPQQHNPVIPANKDKIILRNKFIVYGSLMAILFLISKGFIGCYNKVSDGLKPSSDYSSTVVNMNNGQIITLNSDVVACTTEENLNRLKNLKAQQNDKGLLDMLNGGESILIESNNKIEIVDKGAWTTKIRYNDSYYYISTQSIK